MPLSTKPTSEQQKYIERISNPRTPEDLLLALQNPTTSAYKNMMNMIFEGMLYVDIIRILIEKYMIDELKASDLEKQAIVDKCREVVMAAEERMREQVREIAHEFERKSIAKLEVDGLHDSWK